MADYSDYLNYLHHIDDTTAQEFKKREEELQHQIDVVRDQCQKAIKDIKEKTAAEISQLEASHNAELAKLQAEKDEAEQRLSITKAHIEDEKRRAVEHALSKIKLEYESSARSLQNQYQSSIDSLNTEIKQLKEAHKRELHSKDVQIMNLSGELARLEAEKFSFKKVMNKIKMFVLSLFSYAHSNSSNDNTGEESRHKDERRFCRVCGTPLKPDALFCNKCGTKTNL